MTGMQQKNEENSEFQFLKVFLIIFQNNKLK